MSRALRGAFSCSLLLAALGFAPIAGAVEPLDVFKIQIGGYASRFDTQVAADGERSQGTSVNLKRDLGLDQKNTLAYFGATLRPFDHHEFGFGYYRSHLGGAKTLERDVHFDGQSYPLASRVSTDYQVKAYELSYNWWAVSRDNWALGPRFGLVLYQLDMGLALQEKAGGSPMSAPISSKVSVDLPAPTIGASWRWTPTRNWRLSADAGYFRSNIRHVDAKVVYARAGVEWFPWQRFGFSLDYTLNRLVAQVRRSRYQGDVDFTDSGLRLGAVYRW